MKSPAEIAKMRQAGLVVARTLQLLREAATPGTSTAELDALAAGAISDAGAKPSFLGYHGYPGVICTSVNEEVVHGIPSPKRVLRAGDLVSIDCGAIVDGWHGDSAITVAVGGLDAVSPQARRLLEDTERALWIGMAAARLGGRLTDIGHAVESFAAPLGYGIVREYSGHGIGTAMHQEPQVFNFGRPGRGPAIAPGLVLAVEPMLTLGKRHTRTLDDGWTVVTRDGSLAAHWEHTFTVTPEGPIVLTALDGGAGRLAALAGP